MGSLEPPLSLSACIWNVNSSTTVYVLYDLAKENEEQGVCKFGLFEFCDLLFVSMLSQLYIHMP